MCYDIDHASDSQKGVTALQGSDNFEWQIVIRIKRTNLHQTQCRDDLLPEILLAKQSYLVNLKDSVNMY